MTIEAHVYSDGKTMEDLEVTFKEAMFLVEHQDTLQEEPENFLGFTSPAHQDAVLQFVRQEEDKWVVDIPVVKDDVYIGSYHTLATHSKIVAMITNFFMEDSELRQAIDKQDYGRLEQEMAKRWGLGIHLVEHDA